jgi:hypothetical protein
LTTKETTLLFVTIKVWAKVHQLSVESAKEQSSMFLVMTISFHVTDVGVSIVWNALDSTKANTKLSNRMAIPLIGTASFVL